MALKKFVMVKFFNDSIVDPVDSEVRHVHRVPRDCRRSMILTIAALWAKPGLTASLHL